MKGNKNAAGARTSRPVSSVNPTGQSPKHPISTVVENVKYFGGQGAGKAVGAAATAVGSAAMAPVHAVSKAYNNSVRAKQIGSGRGVVNPSNVDPSKPTTVQKASLGDKIRGSLGRAKAAVAPAATKVGDVAYAATERSANALSKASRNVERSITKAKDSYSSYSRGKQVGGGRGSTNPANVDPSKPVTVQKATLAQKIKGSLGRATKRK